MANYEATKYDYSGANLTGIQGIDTGLIIPWSSTSIPSGFLECNGAAVSRTTYAALFAVVGTTYGVGDGSTTFNLPDLGEKCCVKKSPTTNIGTAAGSSTVSFTGNLTGSLGNTTINTPLMGSHTHTGGGYNNTGQSGSYPTAGYAGGGTGGSGAHNHNVSGSFTGDSVSTLQPTLTLIYIIKT